MKIYSYCVSTIKSYDLEFSFLPLCKAKRETLTILTTFVTKSSNQNFIIFLNKIQTTITGYKGYIFLFHLFLMFCILDQLGPDTNPYGRFWLLTFNPLLFPAQFSLHGKHLQNDWASGLAQMGFLVLFIMPLLISSSGSRACWQYEEHNTCPSCQCHRPEQKNSH